MLHSKKYFSIAGGDKLKNICLIIKKIFAILMIFTLPLIVSMIIEFLISNDSKITETYLVQPLNCIGAFLAWYALKKKKSADIKFTVQPMVLYFSIFGIGFTFKQIIIYIIDLIFTINSINSFNYNFLSIISAILLAAVCEEIVFRGLMTEVINFKKSDNKIICAATILLTSIIWTVLHSYGISIMTLLLLIDGLILGFIYYKYQNLLLCILYHSGVNTSIILVGLLDKDYWFCSLIISLVIFIVSLFSIIRSSKNKTSIIKRKQE